MDGGVNGGVNGGGDGFVSKDLGFNIKTFLPVIGSIVGDVDAIVYFFEWANVG
jgi:hypothetical protein